MERQVSCWDKSSYSNFRSIADRGVSSESDENGQERKVESGTKHFQNECASFMIDLITKKES